MTNLPSLPKGKDNVHGKAKSIEYVKYPHHCPVVSSSSAVFLQVLISAGRQHLSSDSRLVSMYFLHRSASCRQQVSPHCDCPPLPEGCLEQ